MCLEDNKQIIKDGAVFIADSHFSKNRTDLIKTLKKFQNSNVSQLFLMGDIFDFLSGDATYFKKINQEVIALLNQISLKTEVFYFEGNHDFNISSVFPNIKVFSRNEQPQIFYADDKKVAMSHGDIFVGRGYDIFCSILRSSLFVKMFDLIDFGFWISKKIEFSLLDKKICRDYPLEKIICNTKVIKYKELKVDIVIEGHYHQGTSLVTENFVYFNIPAFACTLQILMFDGKNFKNNKA